MSKVYITDRIKNSDIEQRVLGKYLTTNLNENITVLLVWHKEITSSYLDNFPNVHTIIRYGVGYDKIDINACLSKGITVCNNPDYCTDEVSDTALAMILNCSREVTKYNSSCKNYSNGWQENVSKNIKRNSNTKIGFIGVGRIGSLTLKKARFLGFQTCFYDPYVPYGFSKVFDTSRVNTLEELLSTSDIVSLHCPSNDKTRNMVDDSFIEQMKNGSSLVNTARGNLIKDLECLEKALKVKKLNIVCLDVLPEEPPHNNSLINSWRNCEEWINGRLIINPHASYNSIESAIEQREKAAENAYIAVKEKSPRYIVASS